ncbi:cornifelin homolog A-like [Ptychodera flava]|uniref:cornifelin homolog A-like n=1 Tax=Ptychodera flava TaxID=63121 RepID=UPI00396A46F1
MLAMSGVILTSQPESINTGKIIIPQKYLPKREWSSKLVDDACTDKALCMSAVCMPCCMVEKIARQVGETENVCFFAYCLQFNIWPLRTKLRTMVNIEGSLCDDWVSSTCCGFCALCQMAKEADLLEQEGILDFNADRALAQIEMSAL